MMLANAILAWAGFALPVWLAYMVSAPLDVLWSLFIVWVLLGVAVMEARWRSGAWTRHQVIDQPTART